MTLEAFVDLDDKIKYSCDEYNLYSSNPEN